MTINKMMLRLSILGCFMVFTLNMVAQQMYSVSGTIKLSKTKGDIYLALADEETNKVPMAGTKKLVLKPTDTLLTFKFTNIPKGVFTLKCFQDVNGNGKLDKGMFGPKEPWYLSWNGEKRFPPRWEDINFTLDKDKTFEIKLE